LRHDKGVNPNGIRQYQVCGKTFQESAAIGYTLPILENFYDDYGHRAKLAAENKNIDWKAISHALRAAFQTKEILINGTITFPLKEAPVLLNVKSGRLDYASEVSPPENPGGCCNIVDKYFLRVYRRQQGGECRFNLTPTSTLTPPRVLIVLVLIMIEGGYYG
jgi:hypothetical protein